MRTRHAVYVQHPAQLDDPAAFMSGWVARHPIGRLGKPEEIAAMAVFLASDESAFATGAEFVVDGGSSLLGRPRYLHPVSGAF